MPGCVHVVFYIYKDKHRFSLKNGSKDVYNEDFKRSIYQKNHEKRL